MQQQYEFNPEYENYNQELGYELSPEFEMPNQSGYPPQRGSSSSNNRIIRGPVHKKIRIGAIRIQAPRGLQGEVAPPIPVVGPAIAAASLGYTILKDIFSNQGDISWNLQKLDGIKSPFDQARYQNAGQWVQRTIAVKQSRLNVFGMEKISARFEVRYWTNGYSIGSISMVNTNTNDALGWGLSVTGEIMPDAASYIINGVQPIAAVSVTFVYRFSKPIFNDDIYILELKLYGNGQFDQSGKWTQ
ncbi:hypothetical protein [Mucilaginibacter agri]|uniref:Uncharacterized protein n=1 Tax=Mucilaginibacter agri TaxID=2695265 RepID=A0A965ZCX5_9SPHI|nr:hypothetical protein [Mucilaginibacter agri]NCD68718.1 hypothetical protein [Mucilaginibacter agri]